MYTLGIAGQAGQAGLGGHFLRLGTPLPSFPSPLLQGTRGSKRICWNQVIATTAFSIRRSTAAQVQEKMGECGDEDKKVTRKRDNRLAVMEMVWI